MKIDLHTHSSASDGLDSPAELAQKALASGVSVLAICDHDSVAGAQELLQNTPEGVTFLPGVEVSARTVSGKCHILGLGCKLEQGSFWALMDKAAGLRRDKLETRIRFLKTQGFAIPEEEYARLRAMRSPGKPHVAGLLVKYGYAPDLASAARAIPDSILPGRDRVDAAEAIAAIRDDGGVAVWAHPLGETGKKSLSRPEFDRMLAELLEAGLTGMECWYAKYPANVCRLLEQVAQRHGLYISGGSDCHGTAGTAPVGTLNASGEEVAAERLTILKRLLGDKSAQQVADVSLPF